MAAAAEVHESNIDPRIKTFTWDELIHYNIAYLKGEKRSTFYHSKSLLDDQVPEELINLHKMGIFTLDGQGNDDVSYLDNNTYYMYQQRAYLDGILPLALVEPLLKGARRDVNVVFEISHIKTKTQLYLSQGLKNKWDNNLSFIETRFRTGASEEDAMKAEWHEQTGTPEPMAMLYLLENNGFINWNTWVEDGLCYFSIIEKDFGKSDISMPARILKYFEDHAINYKMEGGKRRGRYTRKHRHTRRTR